jgi:hypothetical protein
MTQYAWVIEEGATQPCTPSYWCGVDGFSDDHNDAVRFARKQDAEAVAAYLEKEGPRFVGHVPPRVAEHGWDE